MLLCKLTPSEQRRAWLAERKAKHDAAWNGKSTWNPPLVTNNSKHSTSSADQLLDSLAEMVANKIAAKKQVTMVQRDPQTQLITHVVKAGRKSLVVRDPKTQLIKSLVSVD